MAQLVQIIGVGHSPRLTQILAAEPERPGLREIMARYEEMHQKLAAARPDVVIVVGHDHLNQWFMDNMPAFLVGKAPIAEGPLRYEEVERAVPHYKTSIDTASAMAILEGGFKHSIDFGYSDEFTIDHAFTVPLAYIRPEQDLPIVPIFTNVMAPPIPTSTRFFQVGQALRSIIEEDLPAGLRVVALISGHLSVELGGPKMMDGAVDVEYDRRILDILGRGDHEALIRETSFERMMEAGNFSSGVLEYVLAAGLAGDRKPTESEAVFGAINTHAFLVWNF